LIDIFQQSVLSDHPF